MAPFGNKCSVGKESRCSVTKKFMDKVFCFSYLNDPIKRILNFLVDFTFYFKGNPQYFEPPKYKAVLRSIVWCIF